MTYLHLFLMLYGVSQIRWFCDVTQKLAKIEQYGLQVVPSRAALVSELQSYFENMPILNPHRIFIIFSDIEKL